MKKALIIAFILATMMAGINIAPADGWDPTSKANNLGSVANSRHNMTVSYNPGMPGGNFNMYGEVCVYCHTPHGANSTIPKAPLWNRTNVGNTYTLYNIPLMSGQTPTQPGANSLTCLSCHDGTVAIDSIVNMPSPTVSNFSGNYSAAQETNPNSPAPPPFPPSFKFLDTWPVILGGGGLHSKLTECPVCHYPNSLSGAPDFAAFIIQTDLTNDHPVGVQLPDTAIYDFNAPTATNASLKFYDTNGNTRADSSEIRFYNTGEGYEVECASCHDPHGVPSGGPGTNTLLRPSFLRVSNANSAVCLTCHNK